MHVNKQHVYTVLQAKLVHAVFKSSRTHAGTLNGAHGFVRRTHQRQCCRTASTVIKMSTQRETAKQLAKSHTTKWYAVGELAAGKQGPTLCLHKLPCENKIVVGNKSRSSTCAWCGIASAGRSSTIYVYMQLCMITQGQSVCLVLSQHSTAQHGPATGENTSCMAVVLATRPLKQSTQHSTAQ